LRRVREDEREKIKREMEDGEVYFVNNCMRLGVELNRMINQGGSSANNTASDKAGNNVFNQGVRMMKIKERIENNRKMRRDRD